MYRWGYILFIRRTLWGCTVCSTASVPVQLSYTPWLSVERFSWTYLDDLCCWQQHGFTWKSSPLKLSFLSPFWGELQHWRKIDVVASTEPLCMNLASFFVLQMCGDIIITEYCMYFLKYTECTIHSDQDRIKIREVYTWLNKSKWMDYWRTITVDGSSQWT